MAFLLLKWRETAIAALLVAMLLTIALYTASGKRKDARIEVLAGQVKAEQVAHAVTRQSVANLQKEIDSQNADAKKLASHFDSVKVADASDVAKADKAQAGDSGRGKTLAAVAKVAGTMPGGCRVPETLRAAVEGL